MLHDDARSSLSNQISAHASNRISEPPLVNQGHLERPIIDLNKFNTYISTFTSLTLIRIILGKHIPY